MKFKTLFFLTAFILLFNNIYPQTDTSKKRIYLVGGCLVGGTLGTYIYIQNSWWSDKQVPFHFDEGADMVYAKNVDKAGHFLGGLMSADIFTSSMIWSGMKRKKLFGMAQFLDQVCSWQLRLKMDTLLIGVLAS